MSSFLLTSRFQIYLHVPQNNFNVSILEHSSVTTVNFKAYSVTKFCKHRLTKTPYSALRRIHQRFYKVMSGEKFLRPLTLLPTALKSATSTFQCRCPREYTRQRPQKNDLQQHITLFRTLHV